MVRRRVFLIIMILLTVIAILYGSDLSSLIKYEVISNPETEFRLDIKDIDAEEISKAGSLTIDASDIDVMDFINKFGDVQIIGEQRDNIHIEYQVIVAYSHEDYAADANKYLDEIMLSHQVKGKQLKVEVKLPPRPSSEILGARTNHQIRVPENIALVMLAEYGQVELRNLQKDVSAEFRFITKDSIVTDLTGNISLDWNYSTAQIKNIIGLLNLECDFSHLTVNNVTDKTKVKAKYSDIVLEQLGDTLEFTSEFGNISISELAGSVIGKSNYTEINGRNIKGAVNLQSSFGAVYLSEVANRVEIKASYTPLNLNLLSEDVGYQICVEVGYAGCNSNLELEASRLTSSSTRYTAVYQNGQIPINVKSDFGSVTVQVH